MESTSDIIMAKPSDTFIAYKEATVYFTYSFLLDFANKNFNEFKSYAKNCGWNLKEVEKNQHIPERLGVTPLVSIYHKSSKPAKSGNRTIDSEYDDLSIWKSLITSRVTQLRFYNNKDSEPLFLNVELNALARIFCTGAGCISFKISLIDNPSWINLKQLLALSPRAVEEKRTKSPAFALINEKSLYNCFLEQLESELLKLNIKIFEDKIGSTILNKGEDNLSNKNDCEKRKRTETIFNYLVERSKRDNNKRTRDFITGNFLRLYCSELINVKPNRWEFLGKGLSPQNPNIYIVTSLDEKKPFWHKKRRYFLRKRILDKNKELANLLLNIVPEDFENNHIIDQIRNVRIPYNLRNKKSFLKNLAWDNRLFISNYRQITLLVYLGSRSKKRQKPQNEFIKRSILDALELLHTRWFFSILLNALLDSEIEKIRGVPSDSNLEILKELITKRKLFAYFLHNPLPYRYWGGSVTDLIKEAEENMWLDRLKDMNYKKFQVIDQLYDDQKSFIRLNSFVEMRDSIEKKERLYEDLKNTRINIDNANE